MMICVGWEQHNSSSRWRVTGCRVCSRWYQRDEVNEDGDGDGDGQSGTGET